MYECALLSSDHLTIKRCNVLNLASLLPIPEQAPEGFEESDDQLIDTPHDCFELMMAESESLSPTKENPLSNPDETLYVDGSRFYTEEGKPVTGYAVVTVSETKHAEALNPKFSAQAADLIALAKACANF